MKTISKRLNVETGEFEEITRTPEELERLREQVSKRFTKDGKDLGFLAMMSRLKLRSKPKSRPVA